MSKTATKMSKTDLKKKKKGKQAIKRLTKNQDQALGRGPSDKNQFIKSERKLISQAPTKPIPLFLVSCAAN